MQCPVYKPAFRIPTGQLSSSPILRRCSHLQRISSAHKSSCYLESASMDLPQKTQHLACIENLKRIADLAARQNVEIVIEPIDPLENPSIYLTGVAEGFDIVREVGSQNVKVLYDFYHEQRGHGNLMEKLENNIEWVGLVHIADGPGRHEPGTGEVDYLNVYRKLAELKYNKFIAMEYYPAGDPLDSFKTARLVAQQAVRTRPAPFSSSA